MTTELESKEELIEEMMKESEQLLQLANKDHLYIVPADLGDKVTSFRADWKVHVTYIVTSCHTHVASSAAYPATYPATYPTTYLAAHTRSHIISEDIKRITTQFEHVNIERLF